MPGSGTPRVVHECLDSVTNEYEIRRQLHDVPPHAVYEAVVDGRRAVCKVATAPRGGASVEGRVIRRVGSETSLPVPDVLGVDENGFVATYCEDAPVDDPDDPGGTLEASWLRVAGRTLATLHRDVTFDRPGLLAVDGDPADADAGLRVRSSQGSTWTGALSSLFDVYASSLDGTGYATVVNEVQTFLRRHADRFEAGDERSLLHGWFTPEHVAVRAGDPRCLIDFEHALVGSPEWDYWRAAVPLFYGSNWDGPADAEAVFRRAYEDVRPFADGFDDRAPAYRAFVVASFLDSLHSQRGIDEGTRHLADSFAASVTERLEELEREWRR